MRLPLIFLASLATSLLLTTLLLSDQASAQPAYVLSALKDPGRNPKAVELDPSRKPAEVLAFSGIRPGHRVADLMPGAGYYTLLLSDIVGPRGHVYAVVPQEILKFGPRATEGVIALQATRKNISLVSPAINSFAVAEPLDEVWTSWNYHDFHDTFMGPADVSRLNKAIFAALKPGGAYIIVDHQAETGSGLRDTNTLHRIDIETVKSEVVAAGFVLEAASQALANPEDQHNLNVYDGKVRGHTDSFVLKFRKPRT